MAAQCTFEAIGTSWQIDIFGRIYSAESQELFGKISALIEIFDQTYSRFREDSLVTKISHQQGEYVLPADAQPLFSLYQDLYQLTDGHFTPLIGQVLSDAGYDSSYTLKPKHRLQTPATWEDVIKYQPETNTLTVKQPALLDFGAAGKGYLIDLVGQLLRTHGQESFCIDAGGDILYSNSNNQPLRVGLENPDNLEQVIGVASISNKSICGSAGNRRKWQNFHHIIDPKTLSSPHSILASWVTADTAILADALSTCLFFVPAELLSKRYNFEYLTLNADHTVKRSHQFPAELYAEVY